eukprot:68465-Prymnesium_polylepis.1
MQRESTRTDQTRARNAYGTCASLTGQGIRKQSIMRARLHAFCPQLRSRVALQSNMAAMSSSVVSSGSGSGAGARSTNLLYPWQ